MAKMKRSDADDSYAMKDEKKEKKMKAKELKNMSTAGLATALKKSQKNIGKNKLVKVIPMKKGC